MNWKIHKDHVIRLIQTETGCWQYEYPLRKLIIDMLKLQERVDNPKNETDEFFLSLPHYRDTLAIWSSEFEHIRKEFNNMSFEDYTIKILELEYKLEHITPRRHPQVARVLIYHWQVTEMWYLKDKRSMKYITNALPKWEDIRENEKLMLALFR